MAEAPPSPRSCPVELPQSVNELEHAAAQVFGHSGNFRLHHNGRPIYHVSQLARVNHDDVVYVKPDHERAARVPEPPIRSTQQADFMKHPFEAPRAPIGEDDDSIITDQMMGQKFEGESRYVSDFVRFPGSRPARTTKPPPGAPTALKALVEEPMVREATSYGTHFQSPGTQRMRKPKGSDEESCLTAQSKNHAFEGSTAYSEAFVRQPRQPQLSARGQRSSVLASYGAQTFQDCTTYGSHFRHENPPGRLASMRPKAERPGDRPFQGSTEYREKFLEKKNDEKTRVHLVRC